MSISRRERKREKNKIMRNEILVNSFWTLLATIFGLLWFYQYIFAFTLSITALLLGIVAINYADIRFSLPGISSPAFYVRWSALLFYLIAIITIISQVSLYTLLSYRP